MKFEELLDLTLKEILDTYCTVHNLECGYFYGIFLQKDIEKIFKEYNIEKDYPEAFSPEPLIDNELFDVADEVRDYETLKIIMENLGISKKNEE